MTYRRLKVLFIAICLFIFYGGIAQENVVESAQTKYQGATPKYVFFFIGDGLGFVQAHATEAYVTAVEELPELQKLEMSKFPHQGFYTTYAFNRFITGSAAAGTAMATGNKTSVNTIGMCEQKQNVFKSIAEKARDKGWKVGIVSSASLDHATPAAFYAHEPERKMYYEISLHVGKSNFNYFAGGGFVDPEGNKAVKSSNKPVNSIEFAKQQGYRYIDNRDDFLKLKKGDDRVIAVSENLAGGQAMPYAIDKTAEDITLAEFTAKGIELLHNPKGFFMMIEGGKIDWACHGNDAATTIKETMELDNAVAEALQFYRKHPDSTLIIVTGDHETGGMALGFAGTPYASDYALLQHQDISGESFAKLVSDYRNSHAGNTSLKDGMALVKKHFGLGDSLKGLSLTNFEKQQLEDAFYLSMAELKGYAKEHEFYLLYGNSDPLTVTACRILAEKAGIGWTTFAHTASPVPVRAIGAGSILFSGFLDNTDLPKNIVHLMGVEKTGKVAAMQNAE